jgi:hypothetical protein
MRKEYNPLPLLLSVGIVLVLLGLGTSLVSYYTHIKILHYFVLIQIVLGQLLLLVHMGISLKKEIPNLFGVTAVITGMIVLYFTQRMALHYFAFSVADASDYYIAGLCSVTYDQDIGFFLPLTAALSATGFVLFGYEYAPMIHVLVYFTTIPLGYFIFKRLGLSAILSMLMGILLLCVPLSIWFSKTSFSEPNWQLLILIFVLLLSAILQKEKLYFRELFMLALVLILVPFSRGEAVIFYGIMLFVPLYHIWKFQKLKSALILLSSVILIIEAIHITLILRPGYLLGWQFKRIIDHITQWELLGILYVGLALVMFLIWLLSRSKKYASLPLPFIVVLLALLFKVLIAYVYAIKKGITFSKMLFLNEYGLALGNLGLFLTLGVIVGLVILHIKAAKGEVVALLFVLVYAVFYLPFVMQTVSFDDPHAMFLYWSRYYFSIFMLVHLFALSLTMQMLYLQIRKYTDFAKYMVWFVVVLLLASMVNTEMYKVVTTEAHLKNSYKIFPWITKRVGDAPVYVVYDSSIHYRQRTGIHDLKYMISRTLTVVNVNLKGFQKIEPNMLTQVIPYTSKEMDKNKFLLCFSQQPCALKNKNLEVLDKIFVPISWRRHHADIKQAEQLKIPLEVTLYKIVETFDLGEEIFFKHASEKANSFLTHGWHGIMGSLGALSSGTKVTLRIADILDTRPHNYRVTLKYAILNASKKQPKMIQFKYQNTKLKQVRVESSKIQTHSIEIPIVLLKNANKALELEIETIQESSTKVTRLDMSLKSLIIKAY